MLLTSIILWASLLFLSAASAADLRTGEIPEKISAGFALSMLAASVYASFSYGDAVYVKSTIVMGFSYFFFAYIVYRLGQWAGGDVKLMGGVGCALGLMNSLAFPWPHATVMPYFMSYLVDMGFLALPYALIYSLIITLTNESVLPEFKKNLNTKKGKAMLVVSFLPFFSALATRSKTLALLYLSIPLAVASLTYLKAVEKKALQKTIKASELREGDLPAEKILVGGEAFSTENFMDGLSAKEVERLKELSRKGLIPPEIRIRWGVKFAPILLLSFAFTVWAGNLMEILFLFILLN